MVRAASSETKQLSGLNFRYERKYIFQTDYLNDLIDQLFLNSFSFTEIYNQRKVNNVYFDDYNFNYYKQNVAGIGTREKYRLRWYGEDFSKISSPTIEIKRKYGEVGDKISHKMKNLTYDLLLGDAFNLKQVLIDRLDDHSFLLNRLHLLHPALFNSYERRYFLSACEKFRVTLDFNQVFYNPSLPIYGETEKHINNQIVVLELKYALEDDMEARKISQQFNSRVSRNSKYVQGIDLINGQELI